MSVPIAEVVCASDAYVERLKAEIDILRQEVESRVAVVKKANDAEQRRRDAEHRAAMQRSEEELLHLRNHLREATERVHAAYKTMSDREQADFRRRNPVLAQEYDKFTEKRDAQELEHKKELDRLKLKMEEEMNRMSLETDAERAKILMQTYTHVMKILAGMFVGGLVAAYC